MQVYIEAATTFLPDVSLLVAIATETNPVGTNSDLPSWVPNWSANIGKSQVEDISVVSWDNLKRFKVREGYTGWSVPMPNQIVHLWGPILISESSLLVMQGCAIGSVSGVSAESVDLFSHEELKNMESGWRSDNKSPSQVFFRCDNHFSGIAPPKSPYFGVCPAKTSAGDIMGYFPSNHHHESPSGQGSERLFIFRPASDNGVNVDHVVEKALTRYKAKKLLVNYMPEILHFTCVGECYVIGEEPRPFGDDLHHSDHYTLCNGILGKVLVFSRICSIGLALNF
ncbi:hypothetical protein B7463_g8731, partial [Scytalidium lignicola]